MVNEVLNLYKSLNFKPYEIPPIALIKSTIRKYGLAHITKAMQRAAENDWVCKNKSIDDIFDHLFIQQALNGKWDKIAKPDKSILPTKDDKRIQEWLNS